MSISLIVGSESGRGVKLTETRGSGLTMLNGKGKALILATILAMAAMPLTAQASSKDGAGFAGIEFTSSSQLSRPELEKYLGIRPGATLENANKALERLKLKLNERNVRANIEVVPGKGTEFYIVVDVIESGSSSTLPNRILKYPRHVALVNERPFTLLTELRARQAKLEDEGRPAKELYDRGLMAFDDPPCMRIAEQEIKEIAGQETQILAAIGNDPNPERRGDAIVLLNWTPDVVRNCYQLLPAIDDSSPRVRTEATKYIWARLSLLPEDFPFQDLVEALSRQISRPTYIDKSKGLACMLSLAKSNTNTIYGIKEFSEAKLKEINSSTILPNLQGMSQQLLSLCANPPPMKHKPKPADIGTGF